MKSVVAIVSLSMVMFCADAAAASTAATNATKATPSARAQAMLKRMNFTEKIDLLHGWQTDYVGHTPANTRLGIPPLVLNDGPQGFRVGNKPGVQGTSTQWPSGLTAAATWDRDALKKWGTSMGLEFRNKGANVQLGPGVCVARIPNCGRNFEYLSGEDPFLGNQLIQPAVQGIQSQGVIANAKHYIDNSQETDRTTVSEVIDERTRFELYEPPFAGAVDGGVLSPSRFRRTLFHRLSALHCTPTSSYGPGPHSC